MEFPYIVGIVGVLLINLLMACWLVSDLRKENKSTKEQVAAFLIFALWGTAIGIIMAIVAGFFILVEGFFILVEGFFILVEDILKVSWSELGKKFRGYRAKLKCWYIKKTKLRGFNPFEGVPEEAYFILKAEKEFQDKAPEPPKSLDRRTYSDYY